MILQIPHSLKNYPLHDANLTTVIDNAIDIELCRGKEIHYLVMNARTHKDLCDYFMTTLNITHYANDISTFSNTSSAYKQYPIAIHDTLKDGMIDIV